MEATMQIFFLLFTVTIVHGRNIASTTAEEISQCLWIDYQRLECHIKALDDTFGMWVTNGNWPMASNLSTIPPSFKSSMLSSSLLSSSSLTSSSSLLASQQRRRDRRLVTSLTVKCHPPAHFNSSIARLTFQGLESLTKLAIVHCKLTSIPSESLINLYQLKKLEVNALTNDRTSVSLEVKENSVPPSLEHINFSYNNIEAFPSFVICNITNLNLLNLSNNRIKNVEELGYFRNELTRYGKKKRKQIEFINEEKDGQRKNKGIQTELKNKEILEYELESSATEIKNVSVINFRIELSMTDDANDDDARLCIRSLRSLFLNENEIVRLPSGGFRTLSQLESLFLSGNGIRVVSSEALQGLENLQVLDLSSNHITSLQNGTLRDCMKMEKLYLSNNTIETVSADIFKGLKGLQILDLSYNKLRLNEGYETLFSGLRRLVILNLSHNKISSILSSLFHDLNALQRLDLSYNEFTSIEEETFSRMFNLYEMNLSNNKLQSLFSSSFAGLVGLNLLNLSYNSLTNLYPTILQQSSNLKQILLSNNKFEELPLAVQNLSFLNHLDMSQNNLLKIEPYVFKQLSNLHVFNLSSNLLINISKVSFDGLSSLIVLDLSDNNINSIKEGALDQIKGLKVLKLTRNKLVSINGLFAGMEYLEELDLSENSINMFDYAFLPRQLLKLIIRKNKIKQLGNYFKVHNVLALQEIDASFNIIKIISEESLPNSIKRVALKQNIIQDVKPGTFRDKVDIEYINFRMNQISKLNPKSVSPKWIMENQKEAILYLGGNSLICDCEMEWLHVASMPMNRSIDNHEPNHRLPIIGDVSDVVCTLPHSIGNLTTYKKVIDTSPENFLCPYATHCFTLCHCCDFIACDCQMKCPASCSCFHDDTWSINLVDCSRGNLKRLPDKVPMDATIVFLDGNDLKILHAHHFIGRHSIQKLFLNSSNIQTLHNRTFHGLSSLKYLFLQDNMIVHLNGFEFSGLGHLKELHLQNNRISFVSNNTFSRLTSLEILRIDNNFIVDFPVWLLSRNLHLKSVTLSNNPWDCSCEFINALKKWLSFTNKLIKNQNELFCVLDGSETVWSSIIEPEFSCVQSRKGVTHYQFGQRELPFLAGGLCGGIALITALVVVSMVFARRRVVAAQKLGFSTSSSLCQEEDGKVFDAYISYSASDASFVREILATKLENGSPSYKLCLHSREFSETSRISDFIAQSICFSRKVIIVLSKSYIDNEWRNFSFRRSHLENIRNKENNLIIINFDGIQECIVEYDLRTLIKKSNVIRWRDKNFWKKLSDLLPVKSMYSGFSLYVSEPLYKSPVPLLSPPRNMDLPSSSSVLTNTTGLTTPSEAGRSSLLHEPPTTYNAPPPPRSCHPSSCDYVFMSGKDCQEPPCHCQGLPHPVYSSIEGDSTSVHTYNSLEVLAHQISDRQPSPESHHYTLVNAPVSPHARGNNRKRCRSSPGPYDNIVPSIESFRQRSFGRRLGAPDEVDDCASTSSSSSGKVEEPCGQDFGGRVYPSANLPGFPTDECFV